MSMEADDIVQLAIEGGAGLDWLLVEWQEPLTIKRACARTSGSD